MQNILYNLLPFINGFLKSYIMLKSNYLKLSKYRFSISEESDIKAQLSAWSEGIVLRRKVKQN